MDLKELFKGSELIELIDSPELFAAIQDKFIEAEVDPFGLTVWKNLQKPFPITTLPFNFFGHVADRFPEGWYYLVLKVNDDPNGTLTLIKTNQEGLVLLFQHPVDEMYITDYKLDWMMFAKLVDNGNVELSGAGEVCPIR